MADERKHDQRHGHGHGHHDHEHGDDTHAQQHGHSHSHDHDHHEHEHEHAADRIELSEQAQRNLGLVSQAPSPRPYWRTITVPGAVVDRPGESDRSIAARVAGIVAEIHVRPGETVKPGTPLFEDEYCCLVWKGGRHAGKPLTERDYSEGRHVRMMPITGAR